MRAGRVDKADAAGVSGEGAWRGTGVGGAGDGGKGPIEGFFQGASFGVEGGTGLRVPCYVLGGLGEAGG